MAEFTGLGGTDEVGASCYLYAMGRTLLLIDCGARPGERGQAKLPNLELLRRYRPHHMLLTHAHLDHVGALPHLIREHPHLSVLCTPQTRDLTELVLRDSFKIEQSDPGGQTHSKQDLERAIGALKGILRPGQHLQLGNIRVDVHRAGHLLGAVCFMLSGPQGRVFHAGDHNPVTTPTAAGMDLGNWLSADVTVTESTYGGRTLPTRDAQVMRLGRVVGQTLQAGGNVLIPTFALGRAQDVIWHLRQLMLRGVVPQRPLRLDGMVRAATKLHEHHSAALSAEIRWKGGLHPFTGDPVVHLDSRSREAHWKSLTPGITLASSGMLSAGVSPLHAAVHLPRSQDLLLLVGYQDADSPGRALQNTRTGGQVKLGSNTVTVRCRVETYGLSAHADHGAITRLCHHSAAHQVVLVHGDHQARAALAGDLKADIECPRRHDAVLLRRKP